MYTPNFTDENIEKIANLFPDCVTESTDDKGNTRKVVDFDQLRQELSDSIVEGPRERYHLDWPGKRKALLTANVPILKALRPCRKESVNFDTTENLFLEGDNLNALKLLQETYLGKIKMIYIDPPYNTGKDFIYADKFAESSDEFLRRTDQKDEEGNRLVANTESNGRFHSDWLSMMYPRLKLARNLLKDDGVILISIDDYEHPSARKVCDEIFGRQNFIANVVWQRAFSPKNDVKYLSENHDYVLIYAKNSELFDAGRLPRSEEANARYKNLDNDPRGVWISDNLTVKTYSEKYDYPITTPNGKTVNPSHGSCWRVSKEKFQELVDDDRIWFGADGRNVPRLKRFLSEVQDGMVATTLWLHQDVGHNQEGRQEVKALFDGKGYFDGPKPVRLLKRILQIANTTNNDIILDFFAGSATTAHAVMQLNAEDGGNRKFIMVQIPEECDENSEAFKAGYKNIAEISKERIRRAGKKILEGECHESWNKDIGFRVLKVDKSNMVEVGKPPDKFVQKELFQSTDNIREDRSPEDLLFQVLLDWGVDLTLPIKKETIKGHEVFFVDGNALTACFNKEGEITEDFCKELAKHKPLRVVFRDSGFKDDSAKINVEQIFKLISPQTDVKTI
ncbi:DNA methylase family protein [Desulfosarcina cetonica]|uniref:site-specific DNA-methyltransferase n=1 Tax=Desulfosarcina cetonica TaxID=90730 RepID=UPI0006CF30D6|nr:site-specific DNA-methyltransferase [Desulfosarcina cetonica]VTR66912.1 DNA methylase family protein [Desulfosarcina cetonica]